MNPLDKIFAALGVIAGSIAVGMLLMYQHMTGEMQAMKDQYTIALQLSKHTVDLANQRADLVEQNQATAISAATETYRKARKDEKDHDAVVIADLRSDVTRLRVKTNRPACSGALPGAAAGAGRSDDAAPETLAGSVAARLAGRYADYNGLVDQLTLCQAVIAADRLTLH